MNLLGLVTPCLDNVCQIKTKYYSSQKRNFLRTKQRSRGIDQLARLGIADGLVVALLSPGPRLGLALNGARPNRQSTLLAFAPHPVTLDFDPYRRRWRRRGQPAKSTPLRRAPGRARGCSLLRPERHSVLPLLLASVGKEPSPARPGR